MFVCDWVLNAMLCAVVKGVVAGAGIAGAGEFMTMVLPVIIVHYQFSQGKKPQKHECFRCLLFSMLCLYE